LQLHGKKQVNKGETRDLGTILKDLISASYSPYHDRPLRTRLIIGMEPCSCLGACRRLFLSLRVDAAFSGKDRGRNAENCFRSRTQLIVKKRQFRWECHLLCNPIWALYFCAAWSRGGWIMSCCGTCCTLWPAGEAGIGPRQPEGVAASPIQWSHSPMQSINLCCGTKKNGPLEYSATKRQWTAWPALQTANPSADNRKSRQPRASLQDDY